MNSKRILAVLMGLGLLVFPAVLPAAEDKPPKDKQELKYHGKVTLEPTNSAPARASGVAEFKGEVKKDRVKSRIKIKTRGLEAGDYLVNAVKRSDGSVVPLGSLTVKENGKGDGKEGDVELPADLDVTDVAQIEVADSFGSAVLVGDLSGPHSKFRSDLKKTVELEAGSGAPDASGKASLRSVVNHGDLKERFALMAHRVLPDATFDIFVDGVNVGQATSTGRGTVAVRDLGGVNLATIESVQLTDLEGNVVVSANF